MESGLNIDIEIFEIDRDQIYNYVKSTKNDQK